MNWDDLRFFLAVYRTQSAAAAARQLGVQHSTVGRRLSALEDSLQSQLFVRTGAGFAPTEAAKAIVAAAEDVERRVLDIGRLTEGSDRRIEGKVRVTTSEAFAGYMFARLPPLRESYPHLVVEILSGNRAFDLRNGEADVAVRMVPTTEGDLICRRVTQARWSLYAARSYLQAAGRPSAPEGLAGHRVIGFDASMAGTPGARWLAAHALDAEVAVIGNSVGTLVEAAESGAGIAMMPCFLAANRPHLVRLFSDLAEDRDIWLVYRKDVGDIARVRAVIDFLATTIKADSALFRGDSIEQAMGQG